MDIVKIAITPSCIFSHLRRHFFWSYFSLLFTIFPNIDYEKDATEYIFFFFLFSDIVKIALTPGRPPLIVFFDTFKPTQVPKN